MISTSEMLYMFTIRTGIRDQCVTIKFTVLNCDWLVEGDQSQKAPPTNRYKREYTISTAFEIHVACNAKSIQVLKHTMV